MTDSLSRLDTLHAAFDGAIPDHLLAVARLGSPERVALIGAVAIARFYREMVAGQVRAIRARRADGSFYPAMLIDLRDYLVGWRQTTRQARALRRASAGRPAITAA